MKQTTVTSHQEHNERFMNEKQKITAELRAAGMRVFEQREVKEMSDALCEVLAAGAFGSCIKTVDPHTHHLLVVKTFFIEDLDNLLRETKNLLQVQMDGVQRLVGVCVEGCQLISHFAGVTLEEYFKNTVPLPDAADIFLQVTRTCKRIREKGFAHDDLHECNVCVSNGSSGLLATIIDFGVATSVCSETIFHHGSWLSSDSEDNEIYRLAMMMYTLMWPDKALTQDPLGGPLVRWMEAATCPDPAQRRPSLAALQQVLETILEEASKATLTSTTVIGEHPLLEREDTQAGDAV